MGFGWGNACVAPTGNNVMGKMPNRPVVGSVGVIVGSFKSAVSKRVNQIRQTPGAPVWQRNYYEHIIRDDGALDRIRKYIANNPLKLEFEKNQTEIAKDIEKIRGMIR